MNVTPLSFKRKPKEKQKEKSEAKKVFTKFLFNTLIKSLIVIVLFLGSLIYIRQSSENKNLFKKVVYNNSLSFAKIYSIYQNYLGDLVPFKNVFKNNTKLVTSDKISYQSVKKEGDGYVFSVLQDYAVAAVNTGIVIEVKKSRKYKNLVKIQDKNGLNITYGFLDEVNVKLYDYVKKGELLGKSNKELYLIFEKDDKYLSYEKYL